MQSFKKLMSNSDTHYMVLKNENELTLAHLFSQQKRAHDQQFDSLAKKENSSVSSALVDKIVGLKPGDRIQDDATATLKNIDGVPVTTRLGKGQRSTQEDARTVGKLEGIRLKSEVDVLAVTKALYRADMALAEDRYVKKADMGSTKTSCVVMVLENHERYILTSNSGDSGAFVSFNTYNNPEKFHVEPLAILHNPTEPGEQRRLKATKGAHVNPNYKKLNGKILVSRSFGDADVGPGMIATPEYTLYKIPADAKDIVLAAFSDGFSDVISASKFAECLPYLLRFSNPAAVFGALAHQFFNADNSSLEWMRVDECQPGDCIFMTDCDGHGGAEVSTYLARYFGGVFLSECRNIYPKCMMSVEDIEVPAAEVQCGDGNLTVTEPKFDGNNIEKCNKQDSYSAEDSFPFIFNLLKQTANNGSDLTLDELFKLGNTSVSANLSALDVYTILHYVVPPVSRLLGNMEPGFPKGEAFVDFLIRTPPAVQPYLVLVNNLLGIAKYADFKSLNTLLFARNNIAALVTFAVFMQGFCPLRQHKNICAILKDEHTPQHLRDHYRQFLDGDIAKIVSPANAASDENSQDDKDAKRAEHQVRFYREAIEALMVLTEKTKASVLSFGDIDAVSDSTVSSFSAVSANDSLEDDFDEADPAAVRLMQTQSAKINLQPAQIIELSQFVLKHANDAAKQYALRQGVVKIVGSSADDALLASDTDTVQAPGPVPGTAQAQL